MDELVRTVVCIVLSIVLPVALQLADRRQRLGGDEHGPWNYATWGGAVLNFGALSMLGWMWVTRPRWSRLVWGWLTCIALQTVLTLIDAALQLMLVGRFQPTFAISTAIITAIGLAITLVMELTVQLLTMVGIGRWA